MALKYKQLLSSAPDFNQFKQMFEEAFPLEERPMSIEELTSLCENSQNRHFVGIYDDELCQETGSTSNDGNVQCSDSNNAAHTNSATGLTPIGMALYVICNGYVYLLYFATNCRVRSRGYGSRILQDLTSEHGKIFGYAETPIEGTKLYSQASARKKFYERNGFYYTDRTSFCEGCDMTLIANFPQDELTDCIKNTIAELSDILCKEELELLKNSLR